MTRADPHAAFRDAPVGVALATVEGVLQEVNTAFTELLGVAAAHLQGRPLLDVTHPDDVAGALQSCRDLSVARSRYWLHECRLLHRDGHAVHVQVTTSWVDHDGTGAHLVMVVEDITARKAREDELRRRSLHDPLTGLGNRTLFSDRLMHALQRGQRELTPTCLVLLDLDDFKGVNDRFGHPAGDQVLVEVAARLRSAGRSSDTAARLGGDEFAVVCENTDAAAAESLITRLRTDLARPVRFDGHRLPLAVSIGVGSDGGGHDAQATYLDLMRQADAAMYADKQHRRRRLR